MKFSKFIVVFIILTNIAYVVTVFLFSWYEKPVPDSLTVAWFAFTTGELWALAIVTKEEKKREVELKGMDGFIFKGRIYDEKTSKSELKE